MEEERGKRVRFVAAGGWRAYNLEISKSCFGGEAKLRDPVR